MTEREERIRKNVEKYSHDHVSYDRGLDSMANAIRGLNISDKAIKEATRFMTALEDRRASLNISYLDLAEILTTTEERIRAIMTIEDMATTYELFCIAAALDCNIVFFEEHHTS